MFAKRASGIFLIVLFLISIILGIVQILVKPDTSNTLNRKSVVKHFSISKKRSIGVVQLFGPIFSPMETHSVFQNNISQSAIKQLEQYRKDPLIKAVIIRINSPGGSVGAVQEICEEIKRLKKTSKPVVASVADVAASGGYYVAVNCDKIVVNSGSLIGSIGVLMVSPDLSGLFEKFGIKFDAIKSGPYKDAGSYYRGFSPAEKKYLQNAVNDTYEQFLEAVSRGRKMEIDIVKMYAKGQLYSGRIAKSKGLVDELGDIKKAQSIAEEMADIKNSNLVYDHNNINFAKFLNLIETNSSPLKQLSKQKFTGLAYLYENK